MSYLLKQPTTRKSPQNKPIPGREKEMERNNAGGVAFPVDLWKRMERFLILGSEGGTYYVGESDLTTQNVDNLRACIAQDGVRAVQMIADVSDSGRAPKNDPALYALALAASFDGDVNVRKAALAALPTVARTGTHLFTFVAFIDAMRGWGPALRRAVGEWYTGKNVDALAYQMVKYRKRGGWSHRDVLRLAHPQADAEFGKMNSLFSWATCGETIGDLPSIAEAYRTVHESEATVDLAVSLIHECGLTHEMLPSWMLKDPKVWAALLKGMPLGAMVRCLGRMGAVGLLTPMSEAAREVHRRLGDDIRASRLHPINVLSALLTYSSGCGNRGKLTWPVVPQVVSALELAFYSAFANVRPTGKRIFLGVDVSGSMLSGTVAGIDGLTPNMGAAAIAMLIARTEPNYFIGGFSTQFVDLGITAMDGLRCAMRKCQRDFGGTDCAVAIKYALEHKIPVDAFVIITDGEIWAGDQHICQAIVEYRRATGIDAKMVVMNMMANNTSLCDPMDSGSLDVVGFDASVPEVMAYFIGRNDG